MENTDPDSGIKKETMLGFVYLQDDEKDYRVGVTSDMTDDSVLRSPDNPRLKISDHFQCLNLLEAESAEQEFLHMASDYQTHGPGWLRRCSEVQDLWREMAIRHGRLSYQQFLSIAKTKVAEISKQRDLAVAANCEMLAKLDVEKRQADAVGKELSLSRGEARLAKRILLLLICFSLVCLVGFALLRAIPNPKEGVAKVSGAPEASLPSDNRPAINRITNSIGMDFLFVKAGSFLMGSNLSDDEQPVRTVVLTRPFYLGVYEVRRSDWARVMGEQARAGEEALPATLVSHPAASRFCKQLSELPAEKAAGRSYRLPTEAEWEYACRAGTASSYFFGESDALLGDYAWFLNNSKIGDAGRLGVHPVGGKRPNPWGFHDMYGNVGEWVSDYYGCRGGNYLSLEQDCRSASRFPADGIQGWLGFRVVMNLRQ